MKYVSLFAGIGGFDLALNRLGHECVYVNEWDKYSAQTYEKNFGHKPDTRDITTVPTGDIPDHDILVGGFPCQAFSIAGRRRGFDDTRGTLFNDIARILRDKRPPLFLLENVKGLLSHDAGRTFKIILTTFTELGYDVQWQVLNSKNFGVPQNRERVFIVGHLRGEPRPQVFPIRSNNAENTQKVSYAIDANYYKGINTGSQGGRSSFDKMKRQVIVTGQLTDKKWDRFHESSRRVYDTEGISPTVPTSAGGGHLPKIVNPLKGKSGYGWHFEQNVYSPNSNVRALKSTEGSGNKPKVIEIIGGLQDHQTVRSDGNSPTLPSAMGMGGGHTPILLSPRIRRLTPMECERLQGFPDGWTEGVSDTQRYKQLGNAVTVNVVEWVASQIGDNTT